jgi:hypothetical protein
MVRSVFSFVAVTLLALGVSASQAADTARLKISLERAGMSPMEAYDTTKIVQNVLYFDTAAALAAAAPDDGRFGYAADTDVLYVMVNSSWVAIGSGDGILGTNGGTFGNETNNVWTLAENSEDITFTFATNSVTLASGTAAVFTLTPATTITGDLTLNGGAGALTFGAASSSVVVPDDSATGLVLGSTGLLNLLTLDTQDGTEKLMVTGTTTQTAFHVDVGDALFDEDVAVLGGVGVVAQVVGVDFASLRIHDDPDAFLPNATADDDDLAVIYSGPGITLDTHDTGGNNDQHYYARGSAALPASYVAGSTITAKISGKMGRVADQGATVDLTAFVPDYTNLDGTFSGDLVETAAQSINADTDPHVYSFVIDDDATDHALAAGDVVEFVLNVLVDDDGDAGADIAFHVYRITIDFST